MSTRISRDETRKGFALLRSLESGWQGAGEGDPYNPAWLASVEAFVVRLVESGKVKAPYVFATFDGEVQLEWSIASWEVEAVFDPTQGAISMMSVDISKADLEENGDDEEFLMSDADALERVVAFIGRVSSVALDSTSPPPA